MLAALLALLASAGRGGGWRWTAEGGLVDGGGDAWLGRLESICLLRHVWKPSIVEVTMWSIFVPQEARSRKHKNGWPLPKRTDCTCKKTQGLMPSAGRNHHKVL